MLRLALTLFGMGLGLSPAAAHFVFAVPQKDGTITIVFSETLEVDDAVTVEKLAGLKLMLRSTDGQDAAIALKAGEHELHGKLGDAKPRLAFGSVAYGVMTRGTSKPFLLQYQAKALWPGHDEKTATLGKDTPLEIVPITTDGKTTLLVLAAGTAVADAEINLIKADGTKAKVKTDAKGRTVPLELMGRYGAWVRHFEVKAGTHGADKYDELRHYATLVADVAEVPALPEAFSSFGAITCDGYAYLYGGHAAKTHSYSTETTLGKFRRLNLKHPQRGWEDLPGGVACQGLTLIAHEGKLYRLGGMRPRNAPGEKADQVSLATCQVYDVKTGVWTPLPNLPAGRSSFDAVVVGNTIIATGGWTMNGIGHTSDWAKTALLLDLSKSPLAWESIPQPFVRRALTSVAFQGKVYTVGGMNEDDKVERTMNIFDPATKQWSVGPELPAPDKNGFSAATCVEGGRLYASPADGTIYRLNTAEDAWENVGVLDSPRVVHRMLGTGDGRLLVIGGASPKQNVGLIEVITPK